MVPSAKSASYSSPALLTCEQPQTRKICLRPAMRVCGCPQPAPPAPWTASARTCDKKFLIRRFDTTLRIHISNINNEYLQHQKHIPNHTKHTQMWRVKFPLEHYIKHVQGLKIFLHLTGRQRPPDGLEVRIFLVFPLLIPGAKLRYLYLVHVHHGKKRKFPLASSILPYKLH